MTHQFKVAGLVCHQCCDRVKNTVHSVEGVEKADIDLRDGVLTVKMKTHVVKAILDAIKNAGYEAELM